MYDSRTGVHTQLTNDNVRDVFPDIADDGTIVWISYIGPDVGQGRTPEIMMLTPDGVITRITANDVFDGFPVVNSRRQIAWMQYGRWGCGAPVVDIYMYDAGNIIAITTTGHTDALENQAPEINELGEIVYTEYDFCAPPPPYNFTSRIMLYSNGQLRALSSTLTPQAPDLNNAGAVVWSDFNVATRLYELYVWQSGDPVMLTSNGINAAINDDGQIAFSQWDAQRQVADVFLWENGQFRQITRDGFDHLIPAINNRGEIAWRFGLVIPEMDIGLLRRFAHGDLNCDGAIDAFDIEPFVLALFAPQQYLARHPTCDPLLADVDDNGVVDAFDIEPFMELLFP
jgi:hypothetical protein